MPLSNLQSNRQWGSKERTQSTAFLKTKRVLDTIKDKQLISGENLSFSILLKKFAEKGLELDDINSILDSLKEKGLVEYRIKQGFSSVAGWGSWSCELTILNLTEFNDYHNSIIDEYEKLEDLRKASGFLKVVGHKPVNTGIETKNRRVGRNIFELAKRYWVIISFIVGTIMLLAAISQIIVNWPEVRRMIGRD